MYCTEFSYDLLLILSSPNRNRGFSYKTGRIRQSRFYKDRRDGARDPTKSNENNGENDSQEALEFLCLAEAGEIIMKYWP